MKKTERVGGVAPKFLRSFNFVKILMLAIAVVFVSCDKDDDDGTTLEFLEGSPRFDVPVYAMVGDTITLTASGVSTEGVKYIWAFDALDSITVIGADEATIKLRIPDSLATYPITVTADAGDEYYNSVFNSEVTSVSMESLQGVVAAGKAIIDQRDLKAYGYVKIGNHSDVFAGSIDKETGVYKERHALDRETEATDKANIRLMIKGALVEVYVNDVFLITYSLPDYADGTISIVGDFDKSSLKCWYFDQTLQGEQA